MTFKEKYNLFFKGVPIKREYKVLMPEDAFKQFIAPQLQKEEDAFSFTWGRKKFIGHFSGVYDREFSIRPKSSMFRKNSVGDVVWIHGIIEPIDSDSFILKILFYRAGLSKSSIRMLSSVAVGILVFLVIMSFLRFSFPETLIVLGALSFFSFVFIIASVGTVSGTVEYFETHILRYLKLEKQNATIK